MNLFNPLNFHRRLARFSNFNQDDLELVNKYLSEEELSAQIEIFMKKYIGVKYAIVIPSARSGIDFILKAINVKKEENVVTQAFGCREVIETINENCKTKYCDIEENTFNISVDRVIQAIDNNTKAVLPINIYGNPADMVSLKKICKKEKVLLIEDCAHSLGAEIDGIKSGSFGDVSIFSFGKTFLTKGGVLMTNNKELFEKIKNIRDKYQINKKRNISRFFGKLALTSIVKLKKFKIMSTFSFILFKLFEKLNLIYGKESSLLAPNNFELSLALSQIRRNEVLFQKLKNNYKRLYDLLKNEKDLELLPYKNGSLALRFPIKFKNNVNPLELTKYLFRKGCFEPSLNYYNEYLANIKGVKEPEKSLPVSDKTARKSIVVMQDNLPEKDLIELKNLILDFIS